MFRLVFLAAKLWFYKSWMYAGLIAALFLLAMLPLFAGGWSMALLAVYLILPAYMLHQVEEHAGDRFRRFINKRVLHVPDALSTPMVIAINVPFVWGVLLLAIYLARFVGIGWGLIAAYALLVNAVVHVIAAIVLRAANPGLFTAVFLFVPLGIWTLVAISPLPGVTMVQQVVGIGIAILSHITIVALVARRATMLRTRAARNG